MASDLDELTRVVGTMPHEMAREVLAFARHLQRKHAKAGDGTADWDDDDSRFGADAEFAAYHPWDAADAPAAARDAG
jgi:hypothetical protein